MSILFTPFRLGGITIPNRFVSSACEDNLASEEGLVTEAIIRKHQRLAKGEVGLIISSHLSVHPWGRTRKGQLGIYQDEMVTGLRRVVETVHDQGGRIVLQLGHAGLGTKAEVIGRPPLGPSVEEHPMDESSIWEVVAAFEKAAQRAAETGADGIQLHAAHGYLINEFLSPYYNRRDDAWGGSEENRFRLTGEILSAVKKVLPKEMLVLVKLNARDHTPEEGMTPSLAGSYSARLAGLGVDGIEVSCGTSSHSPWKMCRGEIPVAEILENIPESKRAKVEESLGRMKEGVKFEEGYNLEAVKTMRPLAKGLPLFAVGGWRSAPAMEEAVNKGDTDLISLCRPLIREPSLVRRIREGKTEAASCTSCNRCLIAVGGNLPVRCYHKGEALSQKI